jgi:hypothetical protein
MKLTDQEQLQVALGLADVYEAQGCISTSAIAVMALAAAWRADQTEVQRLRNYIDSLEEELTDAYLDN